MRTLLLAVATLLAACDLASSDPERQDLLPLAVGNRWIVRVTTETPGTPTKVETDTARVTHRVTFNGSDWYSIESRTGLVSGAFQNRADGVWQMEQGMAVLAFPAASEAGRTFPVRDGKTVEVTDPAASYVLPGGQAVKAVQYRERYTTWRDPYMGTLAVRPELSLTKALVPGVGFVRFDCGYLSRVDASTLAPVGTVRVELIAFEPGG